MSNLQASDPCTSKRSATQVHAKPGSVRYLGIALALGLAAPVSARACDPSATKTIVGWSADAKTVVLRTEWDSEPPQIYLTLFDVEKRAEVLKVTVLDEHDDGSQRLRKQRWEKFQSDLTARGFEFGVQAELPVVVLKGNNHRFSDDHLRSFRLELLNATLSLRARKDLDENGAEITDLALVTPRRSIILREALFTQLPSANDFNYLERAYVSPDRKHIIAIGGACMEPIVVVLDVDKLEAALAKEK